MFDDITREMAVQLLLDGYTMPTSQSLVNAILRSADPYSDRVVAAVIGNFSGGLVPGKDNAYPPQAPEFAAPSTFFSGRSDLSALISEQNTQLPMSNADLRGREPEMKSVIVGFNDDDTPIWRRIAIIRARKGNGWVETPLNDTTEDRDERASGR